MNMMRGLHQQLALAREYADHITNHYACPCIDVHPSKARISAEEGVSCPDLKRRQHRSAPFYLRSRSSREPR